MGVPLRKTPFTVSEPHCCCTHGETTEDRAPPSLSRARIQARASRRSSQTLAAAWRSRVGPPCSSMPIFAARSSMNCSESEHGGLSDILRGTAGLTRLHGRQLLRTTGIKGLTLLPAGDALDNSATLLGLDSIFPSLVAKLGDGYEFVLVDSPSGALRSRRPRDQPQRRRRSARCGIERPPRRPARRPSALTCRREGPWHRRQRGRCSRLYPCVTTALASRGARTLGR